MPRDKTSFHEWLLTEINAVLGRHVVPPPLLLWCDGKPHIAVVLAQQMLQIPDAAAYVLLHVEGVRHPES
jgi:hypothetical protein